MADVLDQKEIDSLLSSLTSGEVDTEDIKNQEEEKISNYDFRRPNKLSKEQMRTLKMIYENLARILTTILSTKLRTVVDFEVASIEQLAYDEFVRSLPDPTVLGIGDMPPLEGKFIFEINPDIAFTIIDRLFGGMGKPISEKRTYTEIEKVVLKKVLKWFFSGLPEAWENVIEINPELEEIESNPQFTQIVPSNDMIIVISLLSEIASTEGLVNIGIPYIVLEPIVDNLKAQQWFAKTREEQTDKHLKKLKRRLKKAELNVYAELGNTELSILELLSLETGDVIKLDKKAEDNIQINIEDKFKFEGIAGKLKKNRAVKIKGKKTQDYEFEDEIEEENVKEGDLDE